MRPDKLPHPQTVGESYLAAILDEVRGLRQDLQKQQEQEPQEVLKVKEPANQTKKGR